MQTELDRDAVRLFAASASGLQPGTEYELEGSHQGTTLRTGFRALPQDAPGEILKVVVASCYYDYFHRDADYRATLESVWCKDAAFKILVGDNLYLDVAPDQRDIQGGYRETVARYLRHFWHSGYADVLGRFPTFTTWDDHEFWNNYPEVQCHLSRTSGSDRRDYIRAGTECLRSFQAVLNADLPSDDNLSYRIDNTPVVSFFAVDLRSARTRFENSPPRMMPDAALSNFESWASSLTRPGVLVIGQPLWIKEGGGTDYTPPNFADQYERIWRAIAGAPRDILVVSGDVHHSRVLEIGLTDSRIIYEFVTSPACHIPTVTSIVSGSYNSQDRGKVEVPASIPVGIDRGPGLKPRLLRYLFGTSVPNTLGVLQFLSLPTGKVSVGCTFLDCLTRQPAQAESIRIENETRNPIHSPCHAEELFRLG
jgi:phosphodiesterase/alkaline phosphatase D-like protein